MRELYLIGEESTENYFVLTDGEGARYQMARTEVSANPVAAPEPVVDNEPLDVEIVEEPNEPVEPSEPVVPSEPVERSLPEPDPLFATALPLRPREIQARIRAGASQTELAEEMGVAPSRIEAYSHPVLLERYQVAEAAKTSHPLRDNVPAKLTLFEILATAFAARGHSLTTAEWDATREPGDDWVVSVKWQAGLSENEALWSCKRSTGALPTTVARNSVAADLTDPDFAQPIRSLTSIAPQTGRDSDDASEADSDTAVFNAEDHELLSGDEVTEGDFLRHPDGENQPQRRRRKAVTPHWEDVLLGVRTNTKRPKR